MTKEELKQYIDDNIYENQDGEITGEALNEVLKAIVDDGGTEVEANPAGEATETLGKLKIGKKPMKFLKVSRRIWTSIKSYKHKRISITKNPLKWAGLAI